MVRRALSDQEFDDMSEALILALAPRLKWRLGPDDGSHQLVVGSLLCRTFVKPLDFLLRHHLNPLRNDRWLIPPKSESLLLLNIKLLSQDNIWIKPFKNARAFSRRIRWWFLLEDIRHRNANLDTHCGAEKKQRKGWSYRRKSAFSAQEGYQRAVSLWPVGQN